MKANFTCSFLKLLSRNSISALLKMLVVLLGLSFSLGCNEDAIDHTSEITPSVIEPRSVNTITLTAISLTNRTGYPGTTFQNKVTLKNGNTPITNATVGINDPIKKWCTYVTTNSSGQATYTTSTNSSNKPGVYTLDFFYGSLHTTSSVALKISGAFALANYSIDINSCPVPGNSSLVAGERDNIQTFNQSTSTTLTKGRDLIKDVTKDYLSNPFNWALITGTAVTCLVGQTVPPAGQIGCGAAIDIVISSIQLSIAKVTAKKLIDNSTNWSTSQKNTYKNMVDVGLNAYGFVKLKAGNGIDALQSLSTAWEFDPNAYSQVINDANGVMKGFICVAKRSNSDDCIALGFYKRN